MMLREQPRNYNFQKFFINFSLIQWAIFSFEVGSLTHLTIIASVVVKLGFVTLDGEGGFIIRLCFLEYSTAAC